MLLAVHVANYKLSFVASIRLYGRHINSQVFIRYSCRIHITLVDKRLGHTESQLEG